jgi:hypothetical protein
VFGYVVGICVPAVTLTLFLWVTTGADAVAEPVKQQAVGVVRSCEPGGALYLRLWYSCEVDIPRPSALPPQVTVDPPDLRPTDIGSNVVVEQRTVRTSTEYTTDRPRPYEYVGFGACIVILIGLALGLERLLKRLRLMG